MAGDMLFSLEQETATPHRIPDSWEELRPAPHEAHEQRFMEILRKHGFGDLAPPIPLVSRYGKGRRWSRDEFEGCFRAWKSGVPITLISAALNRNPQDAIYKLLARCKSEGLRFSQKGRSVGSERWSPAVARCAAELFEAGLPAWRIAVVFRTDFEHVEKAMFLARGDYGYRKKNPFGVCTEHKARANAGVMRTGGVTVRHALDAFAGEGQFTATVEVAFPDAHVTALEIADDAFGRAQQREWPANTRWLLQDNIEFMKDAAKHGTRFDLVDLDPFVTCHRQIELVWPVLRSEALLFVTFGGEYRRSFITSNRKAIAQRYGFDGGELGNRTYLAQVPSFFLGWVAARSSEHCRCFEVLKAVRYPNICRFWLSVHSVEQNGAQDWLTRNVVVQHNGYRWRDLEIPSFRAVRNEYAGESQERLF